MNYHLFIIKYCWRSQLFLQFYSYIINISNVPHFTRNPKGFLKILHVICSSSNITLDNITFILYFTLHYIYILQSFQHIRKYVKLECISLQKKLLDLTKYFIFFCVVFFSAAPHIGTPVWRVGGYLTWN